MAIKPFFSLSAVKPSETTYDPANTNDPYAHAYLKSYGGVTRYYTPYRRQDQVNDDQIIIANDAVDLADENDINNYTNDLYKRCVIYTFFSGVNVTTAQQYLLIFEFHKLYDNTAVQFFVGTDWVRTEPLNNTDDQVALLIDVPGNNMWVSVYARLAADHNRKSMGFRGVECFLI
jgi:hypothetical protein